MKKLKRSYLNSGLKLKDYKSKRSKLLKGLNGYLAIFDRSKKLGAKRFGKRVIDGILVVGY